jgi:hypothetical protein
MRYRLKKTGFPMSPEELLYRLKAVRHHRVRLNTGKQLAGVTTIRTEQQGLFDPIGVEKPTGKRVKNAT